MVATLDSPAPGPADLLAVGAVGIYFASSSKHTKEVIAGLAETAYEHLLNLSNMPDKDPRAGWKKEARAALNKMERLAEKRLRGKTRDRTVQTVRLLKDFLERLP